MAVPDTNFSVEQVISDGACLLRLRGAMNDRFEIDKLATKEPIVVVDLGGVSRITSPGVRLWCDWINRVSSSASVYLANCPPAFVDQLNIVVNFGGQAEILTARTYFQCETCNVSYQKLVDVLRDGGLLRAGGTPPFSCETCGGNLTLEDVNCFSFVPRYGARYLDAAAAKILAKTGVYSGEFVDQRPVEIQTIVEGQVTLIKLLGTIDGRFRWRRVVAALEGEVVLILSDTTLAPTGVGPWNDFYLQLLKSCTHVTLVDLPPHMAMLNETGPINLGSAIVHSLIVPRYCAWCSDMRPRSVPLDHLVKSENPMLPCQRCGAQTEPVQGVVPLRPLIQKFRETPQSVREVIERHEALFSQARVEEKLVENVRSMRMKTDRVRMSGYRIIKPLSAGGMAEVFLAMHQSLGGFEKPVALKRFRRELLAHSHTTLDMFLKEARISANLNHPNIVQTLDVGEDEGDLYIAMEYVEGRDGRALLQQAKKGLAPTLVAHVGSQVAAALDYAHNARDLNGQPLQIVHRDVSLPNVLIGFDGQVKLIDFGIAMGGRQGSKKRVLAGNLCYMSPEQCRGETLDARSDLFSLGIVLYELLAGHYLFQRATVEETITAVLLDPIPPLKDAPPALEAVVRKALERKRAARYQTAAEMDAALRGVLGELGGSQTEPLGAYLRELFADSMHLSPVEQDGRAETMPSAPIPVEAPVAAESKTGVAPPPMSLSRVLGHAETGVDVIAQRIPTPAAVSAVSAVAVGPTDPKVTVSAGLATAAAAVIVEDVDQHDTLDDTSDPEPTMRVAPLPPATAPMKLVAAPPAPTQPMAVLATPPKPAERPARRRAAESSTALTVAVVAVVVAGVLLLFLLN